MNIFLYTNRFGVYMAGKLYWRIKKDGKWTWAPAHYHEHGPNHYVVICYEEEEE